MVVREIPRRILAHHLKTSGLDLNTGAFTTRIRTDCRQLIDEMADIYADYQVGDPIGICDFLVRMTPPSWQRRLFRRQIQAYIGDEAPFQPLPERLAFPMMETTLNWCIATESLRFVTLHAAVVERSGHGLVIPGPSGSGKSTLCAGLVCRGWRLLSDEFALIRPDDGCLQPNPRPVSLKNESIDLIADFAPHMYFSNPKHGTIKGTIAYMRPPANAVARATEPAPSALVVFPSYAPGVPARIEPLEKATAFRRLVDDSVNYFTSLSAGFDTLTTFVETCDIYGLTYHDIDDAIALIQGLVGEAPSALEAARA